MTKAWEYQDKLENIKQKKIFEKRGIGYIFISVGYMDISKGTLETNISNLIYSGIPDKKTRKVKVWNFGFGTQSENL